MSGPDQVHIETPEQIELSLELPGLGSRFVGQVVDWIIKGALFVLTWLFFGLWSVSPWDTIFWLGVEFFILLVVADIYFEMSWNGQTPGKWAAGIRVIREGGAPIHFGSSCIRNVLRVADFLPFFYVLGGVLVLVTPRLQRIGDLAAGTLVIRERVAKLPVEVSQEIEQFASDEFTFTPNQLAACSPADRTVLRSFFQRYLDMEPGPRADLAYRLSRIFLDKTSYPLAKPLFDVKHVETFLACLYRDMEKWAQMNR
jgi:uncharacterized RDD family membrane protein YckC